MPLTILYEEGTKARSTDNSVYVQLRKWSPGEGDSWDANGDAILETYVKVNGEQRKSAFHRLDPYGHTDAEMIRMAITQYDNEVASHPILGKMDGDEQEVFDKYNSLPF
jgi:hypothetical protein